MDYLLKLKELSKSVQVTSKGSLQVGVGKYTNYTTKPVSFCVTEE